MSNHSSCFAVVGNPILHSKSPQIYRQLFNQLGFEANYFRIAAETLEEAFELAYEMKISGLNITSPFKRQATRFTDALSETASLLSAVNTVTFSDLRTGHNTDALGVQLAFAKAGITPRKAVVLGAGGAGAAAALALQQLGANVTLLNRSVENARATAAALKIKSASLLDFSELASEADTIISCLPCEVELDFGSVITTKHVVLDANYGTRSRLIEIAVEKGARVIYGFDWLKFQAIEAAKLFTQNASPLDDSFLCGLDLQTIANPDRPIVLIGMMGSGKSSVVKELGEMLSIKAFDCDRSIEQERDSSITEIFRNHGEEAFRELEARCVQEALENEQLIAIGGGALISKETRELLKHKAVCIWLWANAANLSKRVACGEQRPLLQGTSIEDRISELLENRFGHYAECAELVVNCNRRSATEIARMIHHEICKAK
ncbi:MAG: NAD(P)-binding domain-containing protein [Bdellovibrionales bacterium]|nr:NAD(P)-binding domain-containing protein [Bdellovibrionales bacterium]